MYHSKTGILEAQVVVMNVTLKHLLPLRNFVSN